MGRSGLSDARASLHIEQSREASAELAGRQARHDLVYPTTTPSPGRRPYHGTRRAGHAYNLAEADADIAGLEDAGCCHVRSAGAAEDGRLRSR